MKKILLNLTALSALSLSSASAITVLSGSVNEIFGPDDMFLDPGSAVVAVDVFGNQDRVVNGVTFSTDRSGLGASVTAEGVVTAGGVTVTTTATNSIDNWSGGAAGPAFTSGTAGDNAALSEVMRDIRFSGAPTAVGIGITGLDNGSLYNVQLLFNEGADRNRFWDISVDGALAVDNMSSEGGGVWAANNSFTYQGVFSPGGDGMLAIQLIQEFGGDPTPPAPPNDNNPILQGIVVHRVIPEPSTAILVGLGLLGFAARRRRG